MSIKAVGIAIKLTIQGVNQAGYFQTWLFVTVSAICLIIQLVYLNKVLHCLILICKKGTFVPYSFFSNIFIKKKKEEALLDNVSHDLPITS